MCPHSRNFQSYVLASFGTLPAKVTLVYSPFLSCNSCPSAFISPSQLLSLNMLTLFLPFYSRYIEAMHRISLCGLFTTVSTHTSTRIHNSDTPEVENVIDTYIHVLKVENLSTAIHITLETLHTASQIRLERGTKFYLKFVLRLERWMARRVQALDA